MQEATEANPYIYAGNNPVSETDPSGQFSIPSLWNGFTAGFSTWWGDVTGCTGSTAAGFFAWTVGIAGTFAGAVAGLATAAEETVPIWIGPVVTVGSIILIGIAAQCLGWGTAQFLGLHS